MSADAYYTLTCPCTLFSPVCPAFIGRVAPATLPLQPEHTDKKQSTYPYQIIVNTYLKALANSATMHQWF